MSERPRPAARTKRRGQYFLALDFGTSHIKAAIGKGSGEPIATSSVPVGYSVPADGPQTAVEFSPDIVWKSACTAAKRSLRTSGLSARDIAGIGVTSQRFGLVLIGKDGRELYAGPNRDARAVFEGAEIDSTLGHAIWRATGHGPAVLLAWSKLVWFQRNQPDLFDRAEWVLGLSDWLVWRLTGVLALDASQGVESGLVTVAAGQSAAVFKSELGLEHIGIPPVCRSGETVGTLKAEPASQLALAAGIPVVTCGPDTQVGLVGLGVSDPGQIGVIAGWSASVQLVTSAPFFDDTRSMWTGRHVLKDRWNIEGNAGEMGGAYEWLVSLLSGHPAGPADFKGLERLAAKTEAGSRGATAYLGPSFVNMSHVGLRTGGILFPVPLAYEPPDAGSLALAALENFAFAVRYNVDRLGLIADSWTDVSCGGGMAKSPLFRKLLADCTGRPVGTGAAGDATARGVLTLTAVATSDEHNIDDLLATRRRELDMVEPGRSSAAQYQDLYDSWRLRERRVLDLEL